MSQNFQDSPTVLAHIVTFNNEASIQKTLDSMRKQEGFRLGDNLILLITDNCSSDSTKQILEQELAANDFELLLNAENLGFAAAHNQGFLKAKEEALDYVLIVNPDVVLKSDCLLRLVEALETNTLAGTASPKLLRAAADLTPLSPAVFDAAGMFIQPEIRHFDRGSEVLDTGQYEEKAYVFGGTGALLLLRTTFLLDIALPSSHEALEVFDSEFFAYREDADLAWRAQWFSWRCVYVPKAVAFHIRSVTHQNRTDVHPLKNLWSVRNRFLLQLHNLTFGANFFCLLPALIRNITVVFGVLIKERTSRPALSQVIKLLPRALRNRRHILSLRRASSLSMQKFFSRTPYAEPVLEAEKESTDGVPFKSLHLVVVHYLAGVRTSRLLESLPLESLPTSVSLRVSVVDNSPPSKDSKLGFTLPEHLKSDPRFFVLSPGKNLGFGGAVNFAYKEYAADALMILNPDLDLQHCSFENLLTTLARYPKLGVLSPVLCYADQEAQRGFTARSFPTLASTLCELFLLHKLLPYNPWTNHYKLLDDPVLSNYLNGDNPTSLSHGPYQASSIPYPVEQPAGACLLVRGKLFRELQGFDERFWPAWFEDVDFMIRVKLAGYLSALLSSERAIHEGGYSVSTLAPGEFHRIWYGNLIRYWQKHGTKFEYVALRAALGLALITRGLLLTAQSLYHKVRYRQNYSADGIVHLQLAFQAWFTGVPNERIHLHKNSAS